MGELYLAIEIGGKRAAIPASAVQSLIVLDGLTPVPRAPAHIVGLTAVRSRVLTVIDPALLLGMAPLDDVAPGGERHAVIMECGGHGYAMMVDAILDVTQALGEKDGVPDDLGQGWARAASGTIETAIGPLLVIDTAELLASETVAKAA
ncbi:chemotaxis protein CheW [Erythrobacter sp. EC-HK427]|uniref:chemotaxis protein CheW n=1 Tax=Erythrobacter sp. EC-HK427 TaxID=2038396 RepID=UPI0012589B85|nr:chemotaxis protein CheW [Erythrobacter sp. EC-HK427]VVT00041.1 Purine-binding chemotaxis protein CheW [Erythrobacter sp. EC-HK427]